MSSNINTYALGDLHFGHDGVHEFRPFSSAAAHDEYISDLWQDTVRSPHDKVWVLGDAAFTWAAIDRLTKLRGRKFLVRGNHDELPTGAYLAAFEEVYGFVRYRHKGREKVWLSHAPIHPDELRGRINIHGHVHRATVEWPPVGTIMPAAHHRHYDPRYVNLSLEATDYKPVLLHPLMPKKVGAGAPSRRHADPNRKRRDEENLA